jgi:hypothetical protein
MAQGAAGVEQDPLLQPEMPAKGKEGRSLILNVNRRKK